MPFSAKIILILKLNEFKYLPLGPLKNCRSASLKEVLSVDGKIRHKCFKGLRCPEINSSRYRIVHSIQYVNSCGGPARKLIFLEVGLSLCQPG